MIIAPTIDATPMHRNVCIDALRADAPCLTRMSSATRKLRMSLGIGVLAAAAIAVTLWWDSDPPTNPSPQVLALSRIVVRPPTQHVSVGLAAAQRRAWNPFPHLPATTRMTGELVMLGFL